MANFWPTKAKIVILGFSCIQGSLLALLLTTPTMADADQVGAKVECAAIFSELSDAGSIPPNLKSKISSKSEKLSAVAKLLSRFRKGLYSSGAYKYENTFSTLKYPKDFAKETTIADIMDREGNIFLFRGINGPYIQKFTNGPSIESQGNKYSYALSPAAALRWVKGAIPPAGYERLYRQDKYILISLQNVMRDNLIYLFSRTYRPDIDPEPDEGTGLVLSAEKAGIRSATSSMELLPGTLVEKTGWFTEVRVPVDQEHVLGMLPAGELETILDSLQGQPITQRELLLKIVTLRSFQFLSESNKN